MRHEQLWAPWRLGYIQGTDAPPPPKEQSLAWLPGADPECFLCRAVAAGANGTKPPDGKNGADGTNLADRQNLIVGRTDLSVVMLNRYPYNNGHVLVAPQQHLARLDDLDRQLQVACLDLMSRLVGLLEKLLHAEGINIGLNLGRVAGAGVPGHLHWHVVPRWSGDTNFMPIVTDTRVISQSLDAVWELLAPALAEQDIDGTAGSGQA